MKLAKQAREVLSEGWKNYNRGDTGLLAGGISFYALLYAMPVVIIALRVGGLFYAADQTRKFLDDEMPKRIGHDGATAFAFLLAKAESSSNATSLFGVVLFAYASTRLFSSLRWAIDVVWNLPFPSASTVWREVLAELRRRVVAFLLVLVMGLLFVVLIAVKISLSALTGYLPGAFDAPYLWHAAEWFASLTVASAAFCLLYKVIPDGRVAWRDAAFGGAVTAFLFSLGTEALGAYVGHSVVSPDVGPAGPILGLFLWTYYSAQVFLVGACLTAAFAAMRGRTVLARARVSASRERTTETNPAPAP